MIHETYKRPAIIKFRKHIYQPIKCNVKVKMIDPLLVFCPYQPFADCYLLLPVSLCLDRHEHCSGNLSLEKDHGLIPA